MEKESGKVKKIILNSLFQTAATNIFCALSIILEDSSVLYNNGREKKENDQALLTCPTVCNDLIFTFWSFIFALLLLFIGAFTDTLSTAVIDFQSKISTDSYY